MVCIRGDWKTEMPGTGESGNGIMNQKAQQERYEGAALQVGQGERAEGQIEQTEQTKQAKQISKPSVCGYACLSPSNASKQWACTVITGPWRRTTRWR